MAIKPQRVGHIRFNRQLIVCFLGLTLFALAALLGYAIAEIAPPLKACIFTAMLLLMWATSTFDPNPKSWLNIVWQYTIPWIVGFAGLLCYPMGILLGTMANAQIAGAIISILTGVCISATAIVSVIFIGNLLRSTFYKTKTFYDSLQNYQGESSTAYQQRQLRAVNARRYQEEQTQAEGESVLSLAWSVFQGIALAVTLITGGFWLGETGLALSLMWNVAIVFTLIGWHNILRKQIRRGPRLLWLLIVFGLGTIVGVLVWP